MANPGPKSANDLLGPIIPGARPQPPADLSPEEQAHWVAIVGALPSDWFNGGNLPLLKQLCRHAGNADLLAADIVRLRQDPNGDAGELRQTLRMHGFETDRMASLSTKLRLTKLSRYARADAAYAGAQGGQYPKPWLDWPGGKQ